MPAYASHVVSYGNQYISQHELELSYDLSSPDCAKDLQLTGHRTSEPGALLESLHKITKSWNGGTLAKD